VLNGILWVLGTGAQWRELPEKYPPYQTCRRRFQQWVREGRLERIFRALAEELQARGKLELEEAFMAEVGENPLPRINSRFGHPTPQNGVEVERKWKRPDYHPPGNGLVQLQTKSQ